MTWRRCHGGIGTRRRLGGQTLAGRVSSSVRAVVNKGRKVEQVEISMQVARVPGYTITCDGTDSPRIVAGEAEHFGAFR